MSFFNFLIYSIATGGLLTAAWYVHPAIAFVAFVPWLWMLNAEWDSTVTKKKRWLYGTYLAFLIWNVGVSWWIVNSTWVGALLAFTVNSLLMCIPIVFVRIIYKVVQQRLPAHQHTAFLLIAPFWLTFEYLHLDWDLSWTWLNLGNVFAIAPDWVQWYEFTGTLGGTLWVWVVNLAVFMAIKHYANKKPVHVWASISVGSIIIPIFISYVVLYRAKNYLNDEARIQVAVMQPNINPYTEKFRGTPNFIPYEEQLDRLLTLSSTVCTDSTFFVLWPETSIPAGFDEDFIHDQPMIQKVKNWVAKYPHLTIITGADTYKIYASAYDKTPTARYGEQVGWYDYFNTALKISKNYRVEIYHKSKLVPGVEQMPYPHLFKWVENFAIDLGGITGSLGTQKERTVFKGDNNIAAAPVICYESIFGKYVGDYIKNGAQFIAIITNDAWWGNTPGHKQHFAYARLRAIEHRKWVARAANTGISGFINPVGKVMLSNLYNTQDSLVFTIGANHKHTFYTLNGDYLGFFSFWVSVTLLLATTVILLFLKKHTY